MAITTKPLHCQRCKEERPCDVLDADDTRRKCRDCGWQSQNWSATPLTLTDAIALAVEKLNASHARELAARDTQIAELNAQLAKTQNTQGDATR